MRVLQGMSKGLTNVRSAVPCSCPKRTSRPTRGGCFASLTSVTGPGSRADFVTPLFADRRRRDRWHGRDHRGFSAMARRRFEDAGVRSGRGAAPTGPTIRSAGPPGRKVGDVTGMRGLEEAGVSDGGAGARGNGDHEWARADREARGGGPNCRAASRPVAPLVVRPAPLIIKFTAYPRPSSWRGINRARRVWATANIGATIAIAVINDATHIGGGVAASSTINTLHIHTPPRCSAAQPPPWPPTTARVAYRRVPSRITVESLSGRRLVTVTGVAPGPSFQRGRQCTCDTHP